MAWHCFAVGGPTISGGGVVLMLQGIAPLIVALSTGVCGTATKSSKNARTPR